MAVYTHSSLVDAPLSAVWEFHSRVEGLEALTPGFLNLRVEAVHSATGSAVLEVGDEVETSVRPFGVGLRQRWTSRIVARERVDDEAHFADEMVEGPMERWRHTHRFVAVDGGTRVADRVEWTLPGGPVGEVVARLGWVGLEPTFRYRHRRTRTLLEE